MKDSFENFTVASARALIADKQALEPKIDSCASVSIDAAIRPHAVKIRVKNKRGFGIKPVMLSKEKAAVSAIPALLTEPRRG